MRAPPPALCGAAKCRAPVLPSRFRIETKRLPSRFSRREALGRATSYLGQAKRVRFPGRSLAGAVQGRFAKAYSAAPVSGA